MTRRLVLDIAEPRLEWLDLVAPSHEELREVAEQYGLFPTLVEDSLQPDHLPKYEKVADTTFMIVRAWDERAAPDGSTLQDLTRKVAIFCGPGFLITVHRRDQPYLDGIREEYRTRAAAGDYGKNGQGLAARILIDILNGAVETFEVPLEAAETTLDRQEETLFGSADVVALLRDIHDCKHRINIFKRLLWHTLSAVVKLVPASEPSAPLYQDLRENVENMHLYADELLEDANNLLHLQLGLAAHRTNQIVRVLTLFSVFFMPLTFIVGVYGMNFQYMPELRERWGYPAVLVFMALISLAIYVWFRRRGWLRP
ncbi:MAG: CorA family divalent cation transporter [Bacillota bacterium]|jgi:magnesium transporter